MRIFKTKEYRIASVSGKLLTAAEDGTVTVEEQDSQKAQRWKFISYRTTSATCSTRRCWTSSQAAPSTAPGFICGMR